MKKIGWVYQFQRDLTPMGIDILQKRLSEVKETKPETIAKIISSFTSRMKKFDSMTMWFLNYSLTINREPVVIIELRRDHSETLLHLKKVQGREIVMGKYCGEGLAAVKSIFKELL